MGPHNPQHFQHYIACIPLTRSLKLLSQRNPHSFSPEQRQQRPTQKKADSSPEITANNTLQLPRHQWHWILRSDTNDSAALAGKKLGP